jgi:hypothetical protein
MADTKIRPRDRDAIVQSLRAGVVPRVGLQHIQVGRAAQITSLLKDIERVADGGSAFRVIVGEYGAGKTFFLNLIRSIALEKKLVTVHADLSPDRRLHATSGQGRSLYTELTRNLATRARPEGALPGLVEKFITSASEEAKQSGKSSSSIIQGRLRSLEELVGGYDFAAVIERYAEGHAAGNDELMRNAEKWLRAEFSTKTDARNALGVRTIIGDENVYDQLKLLARFTRLAGYSGLLVCLDELVNLYKLGNSQARNSNYEQILRILNDSFQGNCEGLGVLLGGTPEFLMDPRRGLYSYQALASRLSENVFAHQGLVDYSGPVIRLSNLDAEDLYVLLTKLRLVFAYGDESKYLVPDEALVAFLAHCARKVGDSYFRTPRLSIKAFLDLLSVLEQNSEVHWSELVDRSEVQRDASSDLSLDEEDEGLATMRI